jgi:aspartyl-tRNA(Asn)/glutamyl-tRNA(Gln) amidotransferase subunit A
MIDLKNLTIQKAHADMKNGVYTPTDLANAYLAVISEKNKDINAYLEVYPDVLDQAKVAEGMFADGTATLMTGIPVSLKDNMLRTGFVASASSKMLENYKATYSAAVVSILEKAGAVFIGRTNMDEFAMGSSTETSFYGITKNPLDTGRVPGGSSGGAVASVAMDGALCALGSDTGGSIRQPAAFTNLVGLKPTYGAVSRYGIISMGSSLDQVGPITKTVAEAEILFNIINAHDLMDGTSVPIEKRGSAASLKKKIGIPREFLKGDGIDVDVLKNFDESCQKLKDTGYELVDISLPLMKYSLPAYYILMPAEVSSNLARYDGIRYGHQENDGKLLDIYMKSRGVGFGKEVRRRIILGTYILSHGYYDAYYNSAVKLRNAIKKEIVDILQEVDAIATPTSPFPPFKFGAKSKDPVSMYMSDIFLAPANIAGVPAISVPSGQTSDGLPLGLHIMSDFHREDVLFTIGKDFEK